MLSGREDLCFNALTRPSSRWFFCFFLLFFVGEVLACNGDDINGDEDGVNPSHICHRCFGVVQRNEEVCEGGTVIKFCVAAAPLL